MSCVDRHEAGVFCNLCSPIKPGRPLVAPRADCVRPATHRISSGVDAGSVYAGGWRVCDRHLAKLVELVVLRALDQPPDLGWLIRVLQIAGAAGTRNELVATLRPRWPRFKYAGALDHDVRGWSPK